MARSRSRSGGRRTTVEIIDRTLADLAGDLEELGERAFDRVLRGTLDDVALDANERLADVFRRDIQGGPAEFTQIRPGQKNSAVVNNPAARKSGTDVLRSSIKTQKTQSSYLKYALGEEDEREAGDVGAATKWNFIPHEGMLKRYQGMSVDKHGNLRRNAISTLSSRSQRPSRRAPYGSRKEYAGSHSDMFFEKSGRRGTMGFWQRNPGEDARAENRPPILLVLAVPRSDYDDDTLQRGWNASVEEAMEGMPRIVQRRLKYVLSRMAANG
ncbi:hypothetical protein [Aureimonas sp. Leaf324]|uniref:hypothetical protein n=1 Tax=Aureimonas sp. Leaf324 TaxID=1736336 RepID=UPI0006F7B12B|nr:hypothetical protein [Aureimonas sp. Leaf324]KQQ90984.1 hypothetical protein ASF65_00120 [Aureimonas sp. Leaf324]